MTCISSYAIMKPSQFSNFVSKNALDYQEQTFPTCPLYTFNAVAIFESYSHMWWQQQCGYHLGGDGTHDEHSAYFLMISALLLPPHTTIGLKNGHSIKSVQRTCWKCLFLVIQSIFESYQSLLRNRTVNIAGKHQ